MTIEELNSKARNVLIEVSCSIPILINLDTHRVVNWIEGSDSVYIDEKVVDSGVYTLMDDAYNVLVRREGYVPEKLLPGEWGDYLYLHIDKKGYITNWLDNANLSDFYGLCDDSMPSKGV